MLPELDIPFALNPFLSKPLNGQAMLPEAVDDPYAHRVLLQLLSPSNRRYLPQAILEMTNPPQRIIVGSSGKMVTDIEGDEVRIQNGKKCDALCNVSMMLCAM